MRRRVPSRVLEGEAQLRARARLRQEAESDPDDRYVRVDPTPDTTLDKMRVGSTARMQLDTAGGPEGRTQAVVRLDRVAYPRSWRVTLGEPQIQGEQFTNYQGGAVPNVAWNVNPALALVNWGVQGADYSAEVDWGRGCGFDLTADYININVQALNLVGTPATPNPAVAFFPASIGPAETISPHRAPPTRTIYTGVIAAGGGNSASIKVPAFAKGVRLVRVQSPTPNENAEVTFFADAALTQVCGFVQIGAGTLASWQESTWSPWLPPQAIVMSIRNGPAAAAACSWMCIFELELG